MSTKPMTIAITGANGFLGTKLVAVLSDRQDVVVHTLTRRPHSGSSRPGNVKVFLGDLERVDTLGGFLVPGCTVVNLAYDFSCPAVANIRLAENLVSACQRAKIGRLIHCSTAAVFGRSDNDQVNEESPCDPRTEYGLTKARIEQVVQDGARGSFECTILRPTAVFGPGGQALAKLANDLIRGSRTLNYLKLCLFGNRSMNLVCIDNVVGAILHLANPATVVDGEIFIVSQDDEDHNNFVEVERIMRRHLGIEDYFLPRVAVPRIVLTWLLWLRRRDVTNPNRTYDNRKIIGIGYRPTVKLDAGLIEFVNWFCSSNTAVGADSHEGPERQRRS